MILLTREQHDDLIHQRDAAIAAHNGIQIRYDELVRQFIEIKRNDLGLPPVGFDPKTGSPTALLGPMTELAIEEFAAGDPELRRLLIARAVAEFGVRKATGTDQTEIDAEVAELIRAGDE